MIFSFSMVPHVEPSDVLEACLGCPKSQGIFIYWPQSCFSPEVESESTLEDDVEKKELIEADLEEILISTKFSLEDIDEEASAGQQAKSGNLFRFEL